MPADILNQFKEADSVTFSILTGDEKEELSDSYEIHSLTIENEINYIPTAKIVFSYRQEARSSIESDGPELFVPDSKIEIQLGYDQNEITLFNGIITRYKLKICSESSFLTVECVHIMIQSTVKRKNRSFYGLKESDVFDEILNQYADVPYKTQDLPINQNEFVQFDIPDWDFITDRAQINGLISWFTNDGILNIGSLNIRNESLGTLVISQNILDFDAEVTPFHHRSQADDLHPKSSLKSLEPAEIRSFDEFPLKAGEHGKRNLQSPADRKDLFDELAKVTGLVKINGAIVEPNTILKLEGAGALFNGKVFVSGVRHQIAEEVWTTTIRLGLPAVCSKMNRICNSSVSTLRAAINGLQIGVVTQLEENPDKGNRIRVRLPAPDNDEKGIWARVAALSAGSGRTPFPLPKIDDEVILGFINNDPNNAVVLGMYHNPKESPLIIVNNHHKKGFSTDDQIKLIFNDDEKSVQLKTPDGKKIGIFGRKDQILMEDDKGNRISLDSHGINLETQGNIRLKAAGKINVKGMSINQKADVQMKIEGAAGAEFSSSGSTVVKGSIVQIN